MDRALRARCVAYVRLRCAAGVTRAAVAKELGLSEMTVYRWARGKTPATSSLVPVRVVDTPAAREVIVKTPRGLQVEGLDFESLCALITRLG